MNAPDYNVVSIAVRPTEQYTADIAGDAFAIVSGFNPRVYIARGQKQPDPKKDIRGDWRQLQVGKFERLTFDFSAVPSAQVDMQVLVIKDPRMGVVRAHVDPFDGREWRMVKKHTTVAVPAVGLGEVTVLASGDLPSTSSFQEGLVGYSSDVYPSGGIRCTVPFALTWYFQVTGIGSSLAAWQSSRVHPFGVGTDHYAALDFGWQTPNQPGVGTVAPSPTTQIHTTGMRFPFPVCPSLITIASLAGAGTFDAQIGTVSR